ncbi:glycoside hydrolase family 88 protein [Flavivirga abyssicola]|uniref:glycoside hydrolase family 88/105 protein n=1 Tax=Flavivirga abyssicola TaxID=3063533 RepID=UPI0026DED848|nr:glycoside hydrolase family 88 protein [Flavivirga sp. MEBiC07777]WVK12571.1 glycoside hydrolase family 88 protein [Flavivirga sp. MEBiC07777]
MNKIKGVNLGVLLIVVLSVQCRTAKTEKVKTITQKVADWQIKTFEDMGKYRALPSEANREKWHHRDRYHDLEWHCGALYAGVYQFSTITDNPKYCKWLKDIGNKNGWNLYKRMYHADDHAVGQFYLNLYEKYKEEQMISPLQMRFDSILKSERVNKWHWHWCDALFMAPPVWARLSKVTKDSKYLEFMDKQYHMTYDILWDKKEQLFFRDKSYFKTRENNGEKTFWARGNGWVFAGLALMIPDLPKDWEHRDFYITVFKEMAETLKKEQRVDGSWSASLLGDEKDYPKMETSGTAFFTFGLAWGINNGILDKNVYQPVMMKAWKAIVSCVDNKGMLGYVQPVGAAPGESFKDYTEVYGSGAFLAAGTEVYKFFQKNK